MTLENLFLFTAGSGLGAIIIYLYANLKNYKKVASREAKKAIEKASANKDDSCPLNSCCGTKTTKNTSTDRNSYNSPSDKTTLAGLYGLASFTTAANMGPNDPQYPDNHYTRLENLFDN